MKDYVQIVADLREDSDTHHNCAQAILVTFCEEMGFTPQQARAMGTHFGSGMGCGSTCGVVTGAVMALGCLGYSKRESNQLIQDFFATNESLDCHVLLKKFREKGLTKHCDVLIAQMVEYIATLEAKKQESSQETASV